MVEEVEKLKPDLEIHSLRYCIVFVYGQIRLDERSIPELARFLVTVCTYGWHGELAASKYSAGSERRTRGALVVPGHVWITQVIAVR